MRLHECCGAPYTRPHRDCAGQVYVRKVAAVHRARWRRRVADEAADLATEMKLAALRVLALAAAVWVGWMVILLAPVAGGHLPILF